MDRTQVLNNLDSPLLTMNFLNIANKQSTAYTKLHCKFKHILRKKSM